VLQFTRGRELTGVGLVPMQIYRFRLRRPDAAASEWLYRRMRRECEALHTRVARRQGNRLQLEW